MVNTPFSCGIFSSAKSCSISAFMECFNANGNQDLTVEAMIFGVVLNTSLPFVKKLMQDVK